jgi:hypothetical protein
MTFQELVRSERERQKILFKDTPGQENDMFNSDHEAYAVLLEEVEEVWEEIKKKPHERIYIDIIDELVQVAAVAEKWGKMLIDRLEKSSYSSHRWW